MLTSANNCGLGVAGRGPDSPGIALALGWINAKGRWPFSGSGMPTTLASLIDGCERIACSIDPVEMSQIMALGSEEKQTPYRY